MHQALGGARGQAADIEIQAREILRENDIIRGILVKHTGQDDERIRKDFDRDFYMNPEQAKAYGMIDEILSKRRGVGATGRAPVGDALYTGIARRLGLQTGYVRFPTNRYRRARATHGSSSSRQRQVADKSGGLA